MSRVVIRVPGTPEPVPVTPPAKTTRKKEQADNG